MKNAGYRIVRRCELNTSGIALGNRASDDMWVVWRFAPGTQDYYWGKYFNTREAAVKCYKARISAALEEEL